MAIAVWPATLPQTPLVDGYAETYPNKLLRSETDQGPARVRRKCANRPWQFAVQMRPLTVTQTQTLDTFVDTTLEGGALRFEFTDTRNSTTVECRFVPSQNGLYSLTPLSGGVYWAVSFTLEVLP